MKLIANKKSFIRVRSLVYVITGFVMCYVFIELFKLMMKL